MLVVLVVVGLTGLVAALSFPAEESAAEAGPLVETYTVQQVVTVRQRGRTRTVVKRSPQVRRVLLGPALASTELVLRTVTARPANGW